MAPRPPVLALARLLAELAVADFVAGEESQPEPESTDEPETAPPAAPPNRPA